MSTTPRPPSPNRPETLPLFTALFIVGLATAALLPAFLKGAFRARSLGLCLLEMSMGLSDRGRFGWMPLTVVAFAAGVFTGGLRAEPPAIPAATLSFSGTRGVLTGTFTGECRWHKDGGLGFAMEDATLDAASQAIAIPGRIAVVIDRAEITPEPGQRYQATGTLIIGASRRLRFNAPGFAPMALPETFGPLVGRIQRGIRDGTARLLSPRHQALMAGFIIGDTSQLSFSDRGLFRETGVTHLLAVSGQHVMVLGLLLAAIWSWCGIPALSRGLLTIGALVLFGFVAAGQPSVWRAVVMYAAGVVIWNLEANPGPLRPVALAAWILLLWNPAWLQNIGFQLSFMAVLGIIIGRAPIERPLHRLGLPLLAARYLAVSFAANLATIPLVAHHFGFISLAAFIVNPLIVWTFGIILPLGIGLAIFGHLWLSGGLILAAALSLILDGLLAVIEMGSRLPLATVSCPQIPGPLVALVYGLMLWLIIRFQPEGSPEAESAVPSRGKSRHPTPASRGGVPRAAPPAPGTVPAGGPTPQDGTLAPPTRAEGFSQVNPLGEPHLIEAIDGRLAIFPRRSLRSRGNLEHTTFPVNELTVDAQTLYHRLDDLSREALENDLDRLLQAQVFLLAILAIELLQRIPGRLQPPADPSEIKLPMPVKNRPLALALAGEGFFRSPLPARTADPALARIIAQGQQLHLEARDLLGLFIRERSAANISAQLEQRKKLFAWLRELLKLCPR